jgi:hypothetical protein
VRVAAGALGATSSVQQAMAAAKRLIPLFVSSGRCATFSRYARVVELEIEPEPSADERVAILRALADNVLEGASPLAYRSAWREDGIRENVLDRGPAQPADADA